MTDVMNALTKSRKILLLSAALLVAATVIAILAPQLRSALSGRAAQGVAQLPPASAEKQVQSTLAKVEAETKAVVAALGGTAAPAPEATDGVPSFDIARIEPTGEAVIAGRAAPGVTVELMGSGGKVLDRVVTNTDGQFTMIPPPLPPGTYDLTLRAQQTDGKQTTSKQRVAVALEAGSRERPVVALMTPDKPTVVLSQPAASKTVAGAIAVEAVEVQSGGKLHVSGRAKPGAAARFYLNDSFVAAATAGEDGRFAVTINEGVTPGSYRVRLDEVEPASGAVRARAEVPFNVPAAAAVVPQPAPPHTGTITPAVAEAKPEPKIAAAAPAPSATAATAAAVQTPAAAQSPAGATASASAPDTAASSAVIVPKITTTTVTRGDSLWSISQSNYGAGVRYVAIYAANQKQIRDPDLIYPGQVFVLPAK